MSRNLLADASAYLRTNGYSGALSDYPTLFPGGELPFLAVSSANYATCKSILSNQPHYAKWFERNGDATLSSRRIGPAHFLVTVSGSQHGYAGGRLYQQVMSSHSVRVNLPSSGQYSNYDSVFVPESNVSASYTFDLGLSGKYVSEVLTRYSDGDPETGRYGWQSMTASYESTRLMDEPIFWDGTAQVYGPGQYTSVDRIAMMSNWPRPTPAITPSSITVVTSNMSAPVPMNIIAGPVIVPYMEVVITAGVPMFAVGCVTQAQLIAHFNQLEAAIRDRNEAARMRQQIAVLESKPNATYYMYYNYGKNVWFLSRDLHSYARELWGSTDVVSGIDLAALRTAVAQRPGFTFAASEGATDSIVALEAFEVEAGSTLSLTEEAASGDAVLYKLFATKGANVTEVYSAEISSSDDDGIAALVDVMFRLEQAGCIQASSLSEVVRKALTIRTAREDGDGDWGQSIIANYSKPVKASEQGLMRSLFASVSF